MTARYLLDTNIISDVVRNAFGRTAEKIARVGEANICTSIIVAAELRYGVAKKESARLSVQLDAILNTIEILPFEAPADAEYAALRTQLGRSGQPISANDYLIAAHALAEGCILVTDNEREFRRIPGLTIENWLRET